MCSCWRALNIFLVVVVTVDCRPSLLGSAPGYPAHHRTDPHAANHLDTPTDEDEYYDDDSDRSYGFEFSGDEYSRKEMADSTGLVTGSYSYTDTSGLPRRVTYRAGAGIGFLPEGDGIPQEGDVIPQDAARMFSDFGRKVTAQHGGVSSSNQGGRIHSSSRKDNSYSRQDPSYSFSYSGTEGQRQEEGDAEGRVRGTYGYRTAGGKDIRVKYRAGAETGFLVDNKEELDAAIAAAVGEGGAAGGNRIGANNNRAITSSTSSSWPKASSSSSSFSSSSSSSSQSSPSLLYGAPPLPVQSSYDTSATDASGQWSGVQPMMVMDPSYSFSYTGDSSERGETADSSGVIRGHYSYISPEGNPIRVEYRAGPEIGFSIENEFELNSAVQKATEDGARNIPKVQVPSSAMASPSISFTSQTSAASGGRPLAPSSTYGVPSQASQDLPAYAGSASRVANYEPSSSSWNQNNDGAQNMAMDASFQFQVNSDDVQFSEQADVAGERTGSYSYINPQGEEVVVRYKAGVDGFQILNPEQVFPKI